MLEQRDLGVRRLPVGGDRLDVLVVDREELLQCPLRARVDGVAASGDVAGGVTGVLRVIVNLAVEDVPELLDRVVLIFLVVERLLDRLVEVAALVKDFAVLVVGPIPEILLLLAGDGVFTREGVYRIGRGRFFLRAAIR